MQKIKIKYADSNGTTREQLFETKSLQETREAFKERGYYILSEQKLQQSFTEKVTNRFSSRQVSVKELNEFTKLVRTLLRSGMPITEAIELLLADSEPTVLYSTLQKVHNDINEGVSLSAALSRHPDVFPQIYVKTIVAGEKAGALEGILKRLCEYFSRSIEIKRKIIAALIYPSILLLVSAVAVSYMLVAVVPEFVSLFESLGAPLPWYTQVLLSVSSFIGEWFWIIFTAVVLIVFAISSYSKSKEGRKRIDLFKLRVPLIKELEKDFAYSQFARTLSTMVAGGIPLLDSLDVVIDTLENKVIAEKYEVIPDLLKSGMGFGKALKQAADAPSIMTRVITVGEESGNLAEMLENLADHYDDEITELTDTITAMIEPALFLCMAVVVGALIIALLMPVLTAASNIT